MKKETLLALFLLLASPNLLPAQSPALPPLPACNGTEPLAVNGETITAGVTKWYYGSATTFSNLTLRGGTLVVCGNLTITNYTMDSGTVFIQPGGRLVLAAGSGAGLVLNGNCSIINYGTCEIQRNLNLHNGYVSASKPNLLVNASSTSVFRMSNQYLVINNPYSWFINNGSAEFWGIIVDNWAGAGVVEMGASSTMRMAVLINKVANSFRVTSGSACLNVFQYSQFYGVLTSSPTLNVCVGTGHSSDASCIAWGCAPNNWGAAQVMPACSTCASLAVLPAALSQLQVTRTTQGTHALTWQYATPATGTLFKLLRSANGVHFTAIDSFTTDHLAYSYSITDPSPLPGANYYMIQYSHPQYTGLQNSKAVKINSAATTPFSIYPNPFDKKLTIRFPVGTYPEKIMLTDMMGRNINIQWHWLAALQQAEVVVQENIAPDMYMIHIKTNQSSISRTVLKQ